MDDVASSMIDRETALADFDHARDDFEDAFNLVPDEALGWKPEGEEHTVGLLVPHVAGVIAMYSSLVDRIHEAAFGEVHLGGDYGPIVVPDDDGTDRDWSLSDMEDAHDTLASKLREMTHEDYGRKAPVYYPGSNEPYLTGGAEILAWGTEHYRKEIAHVQKVLEVWEASKGSR